MALLLTIVYFRGNNVIQWRAVYLHTNIYFQLFCIGFINCSNFTSIECKNVHANGEIQLLNLKLTESRLFEKMFTTLHFNYIFYKMKLLASIFNLLFLDKRQNVALPLTNLTKFEQIWKTNRKNVLYLDPWILKKYPIIFSSRLWFLMIEINLLKQYITYTYAIFINLHSFILRWRIRCK